MELYKRHKWQLAVPGIQVGDKHIKKDKDEVDMLKARGTIRRPVAMLFLLPMESSAFVRFISFTCSSSSSIHHIISISSTLTQVTMAPAPRHHV